MIENCVACPLLSGDTSSNYSSEMKHFCHSLGRGRNQSTVAMLNNYRRWQVRPSRVGPAGVKKESLESCSFCTLTANIDFLSERHLPSAHCNTVDYAVI